MNSVRLALAQINATVGDLPGNVERITHNLRMAAEQGANLVIFPELAICGYPPEDLLFKPSFVRACREGVEQVAAACGPLLAVVGFPEASDDLYNAAAVMTAGRICGIYRKQYLPNYGVFDEDRYFAPSRYNPVFRAGGLRFGVSICEDIWYPGGPQEAQAVLGDANLIVNISASPYHRGKGRVREQMLSVRAADCVAALAFCNLVGGQDELVFDGGSMIFDSQGALLARGKQFAEDLILSDIVLDDVVRQRLRDPRRRKQRVREGVGPSPVEEVMLPVPKESASGPLVSAPVVKPLDEQAEVYEALVLGTRDYVGKNGFQAAVVGLSGGIDSSLVACIAVDALGAGNVVGVSMPSRYSSQHSRDDAASLAASLGIRYLTIPIEPAFEAFGQMLAPVFPTRLPDVTEENLQSRIRGTLLMALSNKFGWLVLTTGNKSENSVGYTTLYGDMAGGFAVLKDVPKMLVYELSRYRNAVKAVIPENVFRKPPSAELRPDQKDSDSLPEYAELDRIVAAYVEQDQSVAEISRLGIAPATVSAVVKMVDRSEYKRRQAPPGVKITPRAFGKDRRLPITNRYVEGAR